jgi:hypothetical protein
VLGIKDDLCLRPAESEDVATIYNIGVLAWTRWPRLFGRGRPNPDQFIQLLQHRAEQIVIEVDDRIVGIAEIADRTTAGTAWMSVIVVPASGVSRDPVVDRVIEYAFSGLGVRKLYAVQYGMDEPGFLTNGAPWVEECRIPDACLFEGRYWAESTLALYARDWSSAGIEATTGAVEA